MRILDGSPRGQLMASMWYYARGGRRVGPVPGAVLKQLAAAGDLHPTDLILKEGTNRWRPAGSARDLFPASGGGQPGQPGPVSRRSSAPLPEPTDDSGVYGLAIPLGAEAIPCRETPAPAVAASTDIARRDAIPGGEGRLDLPFLSRLFSVHPMGFVAYLSVLTCIFLCFLVALSNKARQSPSDAVFADYLTWFVGVAIAVFGVISWFWIRTCEGKRSACPRCKAWFNALLVGSDARVLASREDQMTYTGQAAVRDRNFQVVGYVDERRTMPVTVKAVLSTRRYRCKSCGHRWETSDVGNVIV
jgi:hypothetical protein